MCKPELVAGRRSLEELRVDGSGGGGAAAAEWTFNLTELVPEVREEPEHEPEQEDAEQKWEDF